MGIATIIKNTIFVAVKSDTHLHIQLHSYTIL